MSNRLLRFNVNTLNRDLQAASARIPLKIMGLRAQSARRKAIVVAQQQRLRKAPSDLSSAFGKERDYQRAFEQGGLEFYPIRAQGMDVESTKAGIQRHYGKKTLGSEQAKARANEMAFRELKALGKIAAGVPYSMLREYQRDLTKKWVGLSNYSERIPNTKKALQGFVNGLNRLYTADGNVWRLTRSIVNAVPDTAYFIPMSTPTIVPTQKHTMSPLAFAFDPLMQGFRVVYTVTGDPMFSFLYFTPKDALKGREIHKRLLDWSLSPAQINDQYIALYDSPELYGKVYDLLYEQFWNEAPPFERFAPGILRPQLLTPDWVDQKLARHTLLTSIGDLGGLSDNDTYPQQTRKKIVTTQNRLRPSIEGYQKAHHNLPYHQRTDYRNRAGAWAFKEKAAPQLLDLIRRAEGLLQKGE